MFCLSFAYGADTAAVRSQLVANYKAFSTAFQHGDLSVFDRLMTADYITVIPGSPPIDRSKVLADYKKQMSSMHDSSWKRTITALKVSGNTAVATVDGHFVGNFTHMAGSKETQSHVFALHAVTVDTWVNDHGTWKIQKANVSKMEATIDGKSVNNR